MSSITTFDIIAKISLIFEKISFLLTSSLAVLIVSMVMLMITLNLNPCVGLHYALIYMFVPYTVILFELFNISQKRKKILNRAICMPSCMRRSIPKNIRPGLANCTYINWNEILQNKCRAKPTKTLICVVNKRKMSRNH